MQRMLGAQSSLILQGLWQLTAHKSRRTLLRTKYLIQSQQQFAKRLTFIFYFGSKKNKRHPQAEQAVSYKPPAHKAAISSLLHRASLCWWVITNLFLNSPIPGRGEKTPVSWWGSNSPPRRHVIYQPCVLLTWQRALKLRTCSHTWSHNHTGRRSVPIQPSLKDNQCGTPFAWIRTRSSNEVEGYREIFLLFKRTTAAWMKP